MRIARPFLCALAGFSGLANPAGIPGNAGDAELVWPGDPRAEAYLSVAGWSGSGRPGSAWPRTVGEICAPARAPAPNRAGDPALEALRVACRESQAPPPAVAAELHAGSHGLGKIRPLGPPFERFSHDWYSLRVDPEVSRAWTRMPAVAAVELRYGFSPRAFAYFRMGLRRDLAAWHDDDLSLNIPVATREVDLNEPSLGYFHYEGRHLGLTAGRFPTQWSPSPDFGLALSDAVPYHDGVEAALKMPRLTYRFLVSSLNPWLEGTPPGNVSSEDYPEGSEEWRQRHYRGAGAAGNAHGRVYDARVKTLLAHRLETWAGPVVLGLSETMIIGGKTPDLRDLNPFAVFHNDFKEGYSNNNVSVDALLRLPLGFSLAAETFLDDLEYPDTEGSGNTPNLLGWLAAVRHSFRAGPFALSQSLHAVRTDPFLYGFLQPLNTYTSRHILTTNYSRPGDPLFYDKLVTDYPIGYLRGGDAMDLWYRLDALRGGYAAILTLARLSRGEAGTAALFERYYEPHGSAPSGVTEREFRIVLSGRAPLGRGGVLSGGAGWHLFRNLGNERGEEGQELRLSAGASWTFPR